MKYTLVVGVVGVGRLWWLEGYGGCGGWQESINMRKYNRNTDICNEITMMLCGTESYKMLHSLCVFLILNRR